MIPNKAGKGVFFEEQLVARCFRKHDFYRLLEEHQQYEVQLASYNDLRFLSSAQELERKRLQKLKLQGKDRMFAILRQYQ